MKQFFTPEASIAPELTVEQFQLSAEEEAIAIDEADAIQAAADTAMSDAETLSDIQTTSEDTVEVVSLIEEVKGPEAELLAAVADMAAAGDDVDAAQLLPMGTDDDGVVSTEGIVDSIKTMWLRICEFLTHTWEQLSDWFARTFGLLLRLKTQLEKVREMLHAAGNTGRDFLGQTVSITNINGLLIEGKLPSPQKHEKELKKLQVAVGSLYKHAPQAVLQIGSIVENAFHKFDPGATVPNGLPNGAAPATEALPVNPHSELTAVTHNLATAFEKYTKCFTDFDRSAEDKHGNIVLSSGPLLGNFQIELTLPAQITALKDSPLDLFAVLPKVRPKVVSTADLSSTMTVAEFNLQATGVYLNELNLIEAVLDLMLDYKRGDVAKKLKMQGESIRKAADATLAKLKDEGHTQAAAMVRRMLPLNVAYSTWSKEPMMGSMSHCLKYFRLVFRLCEKAAAAHHRLAQHQARTAEKEATKTTGEQPA